MSTYAPQQPSQPVQPSQPEQPNYRILQPPPPERNSSLATILLSIGTLIALLLLAQSTLSNFNTLAATKSDATREFTETITAMDLSVNTEDVQIVASPDDTARVTTRNIPSSWGGREFVTSVENGTLSVGYRGGLSFFQLNPLIGGFDSGTVRVELPLKDLERIKASSSTGKITLDASGSGVLPPTLDVSTSTGDISLTGTGNNLNLTLGTSTGAINATVAGSLQRAVAESSTGDVTLEVPDARYRVQTNTAVGSVNVGVSNDPTADRSISVDTSTGNITVRSSR